MEIYVANEYLSTEEGTYVDQPDNPCGLHLLQKSFDKPVANVLLKVHVFRLYTLLSVCAIGTMTVLQPCSYFVF